MKRLFISLVFIAASWSGSASTLAGKYQLHLSNNISGLSGTFDFLMTGQGEVKIIDENSDYYIQNIQVNPFFGNLDFEIEWGSDEERHYFSFTLSELNKASVLIKSCSLYVDGPNGFHEFEELNLSLKKWNKVLKAYEELPISQNEETFLKCQRELARKYLSN